MKKQWTKIAGRGEGGDFNWGASLKRKKEIVNNEIKELKKHIGEKIMLTGGGGYGHQIGTLKKVWLYKKTGSYCPQIKAINLKGINSFGWEYTKKEFEPYIDSWQVSIK